MNNFLHATRLILATPFLVLMKLYQWTLSPDHGLMKAFFPYGCCIHEPTCSEYAVIQLQNERLDIAMMRIVKRVWSCRPGRKLSDARLRKVI